MMMHTKLYHLALVALLLTGGPQEASAQGFLKKVGNAINKGTKELEKVNKGLNNVIEVIGITKGSTAIENNSPKQASQRKSTNRIQTINKAGHKSSILGGNASLQNTMAKGASVIITDPKSLSIQIDGITVKTDVTILLPTSGSNQYACLALMSNYKWEINSLEDILSLCDQLCYGEQLLTSSESQQDVTVSILLENNGFKGREKEIYVQAYLVDIGNRELLAKGNFVKVDTEKLRRTAQNILPSNKDKENTLLMGIVSGMIEGVFSDNTSTSVFDYSSSMVTCNQCNGDGKCYHCKGTGIENDEKCSFCGGYGRCNYCWGAGYNLK